jgi:hypothetical protein
MAHERQSHRWWQPLQWIMGLLTAWRGMIKLSERQQIIFETCRIVCTECWRSFWTTISETDVFLPCFKINILIDLVTMYRKTNLMHNLFLVYFVNLFMFRAYLDPSPGGTTTCILQLVVIILKRGCFIITWAYIHTIKLIKKQMHKLQRS